MDTRAANRADPQKVRTAGRNSTPSRPVGRLAIVGGVGKLELDFAGLMALARSCRTMADGLQPVSLPASTAGFGASTAAVALVQADAGLAGTRIAGRLRSTAEALSQTALALKRSDGDGAARMAGLVKPLGLSGVDQPLSPPDEGAAAPEQPAPGTVTPADELPLPTDGHAPDPTEASRDNDSPDVSDHLADNPRPSPLLAGLGADEWRQRLADFKPGDALPDPRTPTGDAAIDTLAFAAGQQNTTYAWGGNQSKAGPSRGVPDNGGDADAWGDTGRYGYDCGGLVRYSVQQGAGFDAGIGTDAIDVNPAFGRPAGGLTSDQAAAQALPGDVLIFGGAQQYAGGGTDHTGIYIGNGYMMNAPASGSPVRVDYVGPGRGKTDILRVQGVAVGVAG